MGKVTRKRHTAEFKARVALEAIKGEQTLAEIGAKHGVHLTMVAAWKTSATRLLTRSPVVVGAWVERVVICYSFD